MNALPGGFDLRHARIFLVDDEPAKLKVEQHAKKLGASRLDIVQRLGRPPNTATTRPASPCRA